MRLLWIVLIGLGLAAVAVVFWPDAGTSDLSSLLSANDLGALAHKLGLIALVGGSVLLLFRERFSQALKAVAFWIVIGLVLALGYTYRMELRDAGERVLAEFIPGRAANRGVRTVEIVRGRGGDFQIMAQLNGARANMVLDTGASAVVLTQEAAKAAGLPLEVLIYDVSVDTANGRTRAAAVTLDRVAVGNIVERAVPALIAQPGQLRTNLLGMSFLNRLESWEVRGDKLILRGGTR